LDPVEDILAVGSRLVENQLLEQPPVWRIVWPCADLAGTLMSMRPAVISILPEGQHQRQSLIQSHLRLKSAKAVTGRYPTRVAAHCFSGVSMLVDVTRSNGRGGWSGKMADRITLRSNASLTEVADALRSALRSVGVS